MSALEKFVHIIHEYERSKDNKAIYRCVHPKCTHYHNRQFLVGKEAICTACKNPFLLSWIQLRNKKPVCEFCTKSPKSAILREARDVALKGLENLDLDKLFKETIE